MPIPFFPTGLCYAIVDVMPKLNALDEDKVVSREELVEVFVRSLLDDGFDADDVATGLFSNYLYTADTKQYSVYYSLVESLEKIAKNIRPAIESMLASQYKVYGFTNNDAKIFIRKRMGVSVFGASIRSRHRYS